MPSGINVKLILSPVFKPRLSRIDFGIVVRPLLVSMAFVLMVDSCSFIQSLICYKRAEEMSQKIDAKWVLLPRFLWPLLGLSAVIAVSAGDFDTPEDAVRTLEQAYMRKNLEGAIAALDFVEGGRQLLQETNPAQANDPETIRRTAEVLELSFRNELRTKGFPDFGNQKCSFVGKTQLAPGLLKLTEQCLRPDGGKSVHDLIVIKRELAWRVVAVAPVF